MKGRGIERPTKTVLWMYNVTSLQEVEKEVEEVMKRRPGPRYNPPTVYIGFKRDAKKDE